MTAPAQVSEKRPRRTRHYKGELANMERAHEQASVALRDALEREGATSLRLERAMYAAALERGTLEQRVGFWRLVALVLALFGGLAVAALARVALG